jgi:hypothetical protein
MVFLVVELGVNWNGDFSELKLLINEIEKLNEK